MKQIQTKRFIKYLKYLGLESKGMKGTSHEKWDFPDNSLDRPVVIRPADKEIPLTHIHTNLKTLGIDKADFEKDIKNF